MKLSRRLLLAAPLPLLTACSSGAPTDTGSASPGNTPDNTGAGALTVSDAWVKAVTNGMTGCFGTLVNNGTSDVTITGASTAAAQRCELHEVVTKGGVSTMRQIQGGFTIKAGEKRELAPGADHIMLMELTGPLAPGDGVEITLETDGAGPVKFTAVVKEFAGAKESYSDIEDHGSPGSDGEHASDGGH